MVGFVRLEHIHFRELCELHLVLRGPCSNTTVPRIDPFLTWDASFLWRFPGSGIDIRLYALNLTGTLPPWVNIEQSYDGFTHDPKGRRFKVALTYRFGD